MSLQHTPLADAIRPQTMDDIVGQSHLFGQNRVLLIHHCGGSPSPLEKAGVMPP